MNTNLVIPGITDSGTIACLARARNYRLYCKGVEDAINGKCPFCKLDPEFNKVIVENIFWHAWQSPAPEKNTKHHFIIVPKRHVIDTESLSNEEKLGLFEIMSLLRKIHGYQGRGFLIRDGNAQLSAGTIQHLHAHVMVPDGTGRVESPFYKGRESEEEGLARAIVFEKIRQGTDLKDLTPEDSKLIEGRV